MMTNQKFEREAAYRNRVAVLVALVFHLALLGAVVFRSDFQQLIEKASGIVEKPQQPRP